MVRKKLKSNENNRFLFEAYYLVEIPNGITRRTLLIGIIKSLLYLKEFWCDMRFRSCDMHFRSINMKGGHDTDFSKAQQFIYKSKQDN